MLHFAHVVAPLAQRVPSFGCLQIDFVFPVEPIGYFFEHLDARGHVVLHLDKRGGAGLEGAGTLLEAVHVGAVSVEVGLQLRELRLQCCGGLCGVGAELLAFFLDAQFAGRFGFQRACEAAALGLDRLEPFGDAFLAALEFEQALLELVVALGFFLDLLVHHFALPAHLLQPRFHVLVLAVEELDAGFGSLGFVEVLVDNGGLGFPEADEVDDVREDVNEAGVGRFEEVCEGEVVDAALSIVSVISKDLCAQPSSHQPEASLTRRRSPSDSSCLQEQPPHIRRRHLRLQHASQAPQSLLWRSVTARQTTRRPSGSVADWDS